MTPGASHGLNASIAPPSNPPRRTPFTSPRWATTATVLALLMVMYTLIGVVRAYSPVPLWDMWDGYIGFFLQAREGGWRPWLDGHGEHRIVLSRPFFYADIAWFGARGILPIVAGLAITAGIATIFIQATRRSSGALTPAARKALCAVLLGGTFFWSQRENFTWAFQVQFFLVAWLPLAAFYLAARAAAEPGRSYLAPLATVCAAAALGAMANGIFALPILLVLGACIGLGRRWMVGTTVTTVLAVLLFRHGFGGGQTHVPMLSVLMDRPMDVVHFVLRYLGGPLWFAFGRANWAIGIAELAAALVLLGTVAFLPTAWRTRRTRPMQLAMVAVIAYVAVSAFGTALGRLPLPYGLAGAFVSRYTTMGGLAWLAGLVMVAPALGNRVMRCVPLAATLVLLGLMSWQLRAVRNQASTLYSRDLGALALATQMNDPSAIGPLYPPEQTAHVLDIAERARTANVPAFGRNPVQKAAGWLGRRRPAAVCQDGIETARALAPGHPQRRIDGHLKAPFSQPADGAALVVDERDIIVGWALVRPRAARERGDMVDGPAFSGFVDDPRTDHAGWTTTSLRICAMPTGASFAYSE
jgi:hypothetical protein